MPSFKYRDVIRRICKKGFQFIRQGKGSHEIWRHPDTGKITVVPHHPGNLQNGTVADIARQTGFKNLKEFQDFN